MEIKYRNAIFLDVEVVNFGNPLTNTVSDICIVDIDGTVLLRSGSLLDCYDDFVKLVSGVFVIAFDSAQDANFISRDLSYRNLSPVEISWVCGKRLLEEYLSVQDLSLKKACRLMQVKFPNHTAQRDAKSLASIFRKIIKNNTEE